ncbi:hypothetical protein C8R47DRAFT_1164821 [Mycena vitilis]|nr:hypothetical protein C8R47DRAFT_1164821 [Mycena vitilis]
MVPQPDPGVPRLPADLIQPVIQELADHHPTLLSCSLVSQGWLPLARNHLTFFTKPQNMTEFSALLQSPTSFLLSTIRRLDISHAPGPLLQMLPQFRRLRSLSMWSAAFPDDLPLLPALTELELWGYFPSYSSFAQFLSNLPTLRSLTLANFKCDASSQNRDILPSLELETASFECREEFTDALFVWAPLTRELTWGFAEQDMSPQYLEKLSRYLYRLGTRLRYLGLDFWTTQHIERARELDFSHNTGLNHLRLGDTVMFGYDPAPASSEVNISPHLERLLSQITPHCRLQTLSFGVETESGRASSSSPPWLSLAQFGQLLSKTAVCCCAGDRVRGRRRRALPEGFRTPL